MEDVGLFEAGGGEDVQHALRGHRPARRSGARRGLDVGGQRAFQLVGEAQVVDDEAAGLVAEHAVDARDGLHQPRGRASACRHTSCAGWAGRNR